MSNKTIHIRYDSHFPQDKIYELSVNQTICLTFNAYNSLVDFEKKWDVIVILNKGGFFDNAHVIVEKNEKMTQFNTIMGLLIKNSETRLTNNSSLLYEDIEHKLERCNSNIESFDTKMDVIQTSSHQSSNHQSYFNQIVELIKTKKLALPNFKKIDRYAIKRQINWLRCMLSLNVKTLPENEALKIIELLRSLDIDTVKNSLSI